MLSNNTVTDWLSKYDHRLFLHLLLSYGLGATFAASAAFLWSGCDIRFNVLMHLYLTTTKPLAIGILVKALIRLGESLMSTGTVVTSTTGQSLHLAIPYL